MKPGKVLCCLFFSVLVLSACDDKKDGFSGLSDLVKERQGIRQTLSEKTARKNALEKQGAKADPKEDTVIDRVKKKEEMSAIVLYERDIEVVDSFSQQPLAKGIAYLNKEGQIVKIKIIKE